MKRDPLLSSVIAAILSVCVAMSGLACLASAFDLPVKSWLFLFLGCLLVACATLICLGSVKRSLAGAVLMLVLLWIFLSGEALPLSLEALLYRLSYIYDLGYGWGVIYWSGTELTAVSCGYALLLMGSLITILVSITVRCRRLPAFGLLAGLAPLMLCCVVTDTIPGNLSLMGLFISLLLVLLPHLSRRSDPRQANRITALLLIPVILFTGVIFGQAHRFPYEEEATRIQDWLLGLFTDPPEPGPGIGPGPGGLTGGVTGDTIDLSLIGPMTQSNLTELYVTAPNAGKLYLRGRAYDLYTGTGWDSTADTAGENGWPLGPFYSGGTVRVSVTSDTLPRFFGYYPPDADWTDALHDGMLTNPVGARLYSFRYQKCDASVTFTPLTEQETATYLQLPESTRLAAEALIAPLLADETLADKAQLAEAIRQYVYAVAAYDLNTPAMPSGTTDFALWFLESSDSGYCTHFATAATVLLRAAGIPARYVTGYMIRTTAGVTQAVSGKYAHAWVEYLDPWQGWSVLDPTPMVEEPDPTDPTQATPPTEQTQPTDPTQPLPTPTVPPAPSDPATRPTVPPSTVTDPTHDGGGAIPNPPDLTWLKYSGLILGICALVILQHGLRKHLRRQRLEKLPQNKRALRCWRYIRRGCRMVRHAPPEELAALANKAAFSRHTLTDEELEQFCDWLRSFKVYLLRRPIPLRWLLKLLFAL